MTGVQTWLFRSDFLKEKALCFSNGKNAVRDSADGVFGEYFGRESVVLERDFDVLKSNLTAWRKRLKLV